MILRRLTALSLAAVLAGSALAAQAQATLTLAEQPVRLIRGATLFDVYKPVAANADFATGERSMAVRLELLDESTPLTEDRIDLRDDTGV